MAILFPETQSVINLDQPAPPALSSKDNYLSSKKTMRIRAGDGLENDPSFYLFNHSPTSVVFEAKSSPLLTVEERSAAEHSEPHSKLADWNVKRLKAVAMADRLLPIDPKLAARVEKCGRRLAWHETVCKHHFKGRIINTDFCGFRPCPICSARRRQRELDCVVPALQKFEATAVPPPKGSTNRSKAYPQFITVSYKNVRHLKPASYYSRTLRNFFKTKFFEQQGFLAARSYQEITLNPDTGEFHVHWHCLAYFSQPVPIYQNEYGQMQWDWAVNKWMAKAWETVTGGESYIVQGFEFDGNYPELIKYVVKDVSDFPDAQFAEFVKWQKGARFIITSGTLSGNKEFRAAVKEAEALAKEKRIEKLVCPHCGETRTIRFEAYYSRRSKGYIIDYICPSSVPLVLRC